MAYDLVGQKFGRLTAMFYVGAGRWRCVCECGGSAVVITHNLMSGNTASCGCKFREVHLKHGMARTPINQVWRSMRQRCNNPKDAAYANYGGRGIKVCERWEDFSLFIADMGMRPKGFEIDRIDNDGPYSRENCRWASKKVNLNNKRSSHVVEWQGQALTVTAWSELLGIHLRTLCNRLSRGWSVERAFTTLTQK